MLEIALDHTNQCAIGAVDVDPVLIAELRHEDSAVFGQDPLAEGGEVLFRLVDIQVGKLVLLGIIVDGVVHRAVGGVAANEIVADLEALFLVDGAEDAPQDHVPAGALHVDQREEAARGWIIAAGDEGLRGVVLAVQAYDPAGEGLHQADRSVGHHEQIDGEATFARAVAFAAQGVRELAVGREDIDLGKLGVQQIDHPVRVSDDAGDQAEEVLFVILAAHAPEFFDFQGLDAIARLGAVAHVGDAVDDDFLGRCWRHGAQAANQGADQD